jgi:hypothetical protein
LEKVDGPHGPWLFMGITKEPRLDERLRFILGLIKGNEF